MRKLNVVVDEPKRPSHFGEETNVRVPRDNTEVDYGGAEEPTPEYGFAPVADPTPVYLVEPPPQNTSIREWSAGTYELTTAPTQIAGANPSRDRLVIRNIDAANSVLLTRRQMDSAILAFEIPFGEREELTHNREVWARSNTGTCEITVYTERSVVDD